VRWRWRRRSRSRAQRLDQPLADRAFRFGFRDDRFDGGYHILRCDRSAAAPPQRAHQVAARAESACARGERGQERIDDRALVALACHQRAQFVECRGNPRRSSSSNVVGSAAIPCVVMVRSSARRSGPTPSEGADAAPRFLKIGGVTGMSNDASSCTSRQNFGCETAQAAPAHPAARAGSACARDCHAADDRRAPRPSREDHWRRVPRRIRECSGRAAVRAGHSAQNHRARIRAQHRDRLRLRIGINVGDIIVDGDDVAGTASTSPRASKRSRRPAASAFRGPCASRFTTISASRSPISARRS